MNYVEVKIIVGLIYFNDVYQQLSMILCMFLFEVFDFEFVQKSMS